MFGIGKERCAATQPDYATPADFCQTFNDEMKSLYRLAFLLTASHASAEQCFVASIGDAVEGNPVFKQWAHQWARRIVIKNAIRIISPASAQAGSERNAWDEEDDKSSDGLPLRAITQLVPLERFVFVMTVLERQSERECAVLLGCAVEVVREARARAQQDIARTSMAAEPESKRQDSVFSSHPVTAGSVAARGGGKCFDR